MGGAKKNPEVRILYFRVIKSGDDLLSHLRAVSSALVGLTSLFGMGRGGPHRNSHHKIFILRSFSEGGSSSINEDVKSLKDI